MSVNKNKSSNDATIKISSQELSPELSTVNLFKEQIQSESGVLGLVKYLYYEVFKSLFFGRASRGEYILSLLMLTAMAGLFYILANIAGLFGNILGFIFIIGYFIFIINITVSRCHDLNKNAWFVFPVFIAPIIIILLQGALIFTFAAGSSGISSYGPFVLIAGGLFAIWLLVVYVFLIFFKGSAGDNKYGSERLSQQPFPDGIYRSVAFILLVIIIGINLLF